MANDIPNKTKSQSNNSENTSPSSNIDQQKVPPLRIVLNTAGNQAKSSTVATTHNIHTLNANQSKKDKTNANQEAKVDSSGGGALKGGNKVRIKLGTNKQQSSKSSVNNSNSDSTLDKSIGPFHGVQKLNNNKQGGNSISNDAKQDESKDETSSTTTYHQSHLRRITRRSQRAVQLVSNEDEESVSSMTSVDENSNTQTTTTTTNNNSDITAPDSEQSNILAPGASTSTATNTTSSTNATANGSSSADTPRRYKRRKGEISESQNLDNDSLFGAQNYKLPGQNSFELFKNIRKQVDKRINNLSCLTHPRAPYGFRDYMLTRGAYLLDGNKLGNGTNLYLTEDGGFHSIPVHGKYHALRYNRVNYSVPNGAKVPLGLPVNSPLYDLFVEQEKERFRMRMQHIKEREKLTLAAEQEIMRVYNQAALSAVDQSEPLSACTMLKHQEIYNYLDADGYTILSREDTHRDQGTKPEGVRTRRRQHGAASPQPQPPPPPPPAPPSSQSSAAKNLNEDFSSTKGSSKTKNENSPNDTRNQPPEDGVESTRNDAIENKNIDTEMIDGESEKQHQAKEGVEAGESEESDKKQETRSNQSPEAEAKVKDENPKHTEKPNNVSSSSADKNDATKGDKMDIKEEIDRVDDKECKNDETKSVKSSGPKADKNEIEKSKSPTDEKKDMAKVDDESKSENVRQKATPENGDDSSKNTDQNEIAVEPMEGIEQISQQSESDDQTSSSNDLFAGNSNSGQSVTDEERKTHDKEKFLAHLQEIDDKWEKIRCEMLIRHRNEAESLHAIQKLEWEWKTKEIGACDVRTNLIVDSTLVPKLNIYSQDY